MENKFYVYVHFKKDSLQPFYVGKGKDDRFKQKTNRNKYWKHIVNKYGYFPQIMENNLTEEKAFEKERFYIEVLGKENLCNMTDGGEGTSGNKLSIESKRKIGLASIGRKKTRECILSIADKNRGKKRTDETKKKMSEKQKGKNNSMYGINGEKSPRAKKVINIQTGEIYGCVNEVAKLLNIKYGTLKSYLNGRRINKTQFKYL
jgi:hypothetical protein